MNRVEVIKYLEDCRSQAIHDGVIAIGRWLTDVFDMAIAALREQDLRERSEPLTQEELRGMVGEWVWVVVDYQHADQHYQCDGWALVSTPAFVAYLEQTLPIDFYGKKFLAYRYKPEGAEE